MSHKLANIDTRQSVISYPEIGVIFSIFLIVLFFLFPKDHLEKQILKESSNYDLTVIYLQNLIKLEPKNSKLLLTLAKTLTEQKKYNLATKLLEVLKDDSSSSIRQQSTLLQIQINEILLEKVSIEDERKILLSKNSKLLESILNDKITDLDTGKKLYNIALANNNKELALKLNKTILNFTEKKEHIKWLKNIHYLSQELGNVELDKEALLELIKKDKNNTHTWIDSYTSTFANDKNIENIIQTLDLKDEIKAYFYTSSKQYDKASKIYLSLYEKEENIEKKKKIFSQLIEMYRSNNNVIKAATIAHKLENDFLDDTTLVKKLLKLYIEANRAQYAKELSLKLINLEDTR